MADISIGCIALTSHARAIIVQIGEGYAASEIDQADFASRQLPLAAVLCKDVDVAPDRASNGAGPGQPFVRADEGNAGILSPAIIFMHNRPPPSDHRPLHCFGRSEEHTSALQSLMRISYAVFCLTQKTTTHNHIYK